MTKKAQKIDNLELEGLMKAVKANQLDEDQMKAIFEILSTFNDICSSLEEKRMSLKRLKDMLGIKTEKEPNSRGIANPPKKRKKTLGNSSDEEEELSGLEKEKESFHTVENYEKGQFCPECKIGKLYLESQRQQTFEVFVGKSFIEKEIHHQEVLTCNCCNESYKAELPKEINPKKKYTASAVAISIQLRYMMGFPHYSLSLLQSILKKSLSCSTLFNMAEDFANKSQRIFDRLKEVASNSYYFGIDDTRMKILFHNNQIKNRTGIRTSALVAEDKAPYFEKVKEGEEALLKKGNKICLFQTGSQIAGEFCDDILEHKNKGTPKIILMSDALSANNPKENYNLCERASCLVHARRNFYSIKDFYKEIVPDILDLFSLVFNVEKECKLNELVGEERLKKHQDLSAKALVKIYLICRTHLKEGKVEPKSSIGKAMSYFLKHFKSLVCFLRLLDCPLENNETERLLKRMIKHRKNSMFYKTDVGALIGDIIMSLGFTAWEAGIDSKSYFEDIYLNFDKSEDVNNWLPWNWLKYRSNQILNTN